MKKTLKVSKIIFETAFSAVIFVMIPLVGITLLTSKGMLPGMQSFTVLTGSMAPHIPTGSVVYVMKNSSIEQGDVITFKRGGKNVTHRVVEVTDKAGNPVSSLVSPLQPVQPEELYYRTKGDANNTVDSELVPQSQVIGQVEVMAPQIGYFASLVRSIPGFLLLVVTPTMLFIGSELWKIKREIEKSVERRTLEKAGLI